MQVSISYPGASAQVVADTVAAPIEQQVNGVEGMLYMSSQMGNDGTYTLTVTFDIGTDLNTALVMVQNRVPWPCRSCRPQVQNQGITIRKKTPDILMIVNFFSPDGRYDDIYLSNFATINIKDELLRVDGVSDITYLGERDYSIRAWLDPQKLASRNMTAIDVANAIRSQNLDAPAGQIGQPPVARGPVLSAADRHAGPAHRPGAVRRHHRQGRPEPPRRRLPRHRGAVPGRDRARPCRRPPAPAPRTAATSTQHDQQRHRPATATTRRHRRSSDHEHAAGTTSGTPTLSGGGTTGGGDNAAAAAARQPAAARPRRRRHDRRRGTTGGGTTSTCRPAAVEQSSAQRHARPPAAVLSGATLGRGRRPAVGQHRPPARRGPRRAGRPELQPGLHLRRPARPSASAVYQLPGTNALDVADRVRAKMEELKTRFPDGVDYDIAYDTTPFIRESVDDVVQTLLEAVVLVGVVVLVFLQDWRAVLMPLIAVPVAIIGTFAVMAALGFSLNNISLFGLVLAIGIVVDDAIVVVENVERWLEHGLPPREATRKAMDEVTGPIIAVALVLCAVFVPCAFISGITGQFFRQFAVTIAVSTVISAINSLTLSPALAAILLQAARRPSRPVDLAAGHGAGLVLPAVQPGVRRRHRRPMPGRSASCCASACWCCWSTAACWC